MDHHQRDFFPKTFSNREIENHSSNEKDDKLCSLSDLDELERCIPEFDEIFDNLDLDAIGAIENICLESQPYRFGESEEEKWKLAENNANLSNVNIANENASFNFVPDSPFIILQQGNPLDSRSSNCTLGVPLYTLDDKDEEIDNYSTTSRISRSVSDASESDSIESNMRDHIEKYLFTSNEQKEIQSSPFTTASSREEYRAASDVCNRNELFDNDNGTSKSFLAHEKGTFLNNTNNQMTTGATRNCGISRGQRDDDVQGISQNGKEPLKQILFGAQVSENNTSKFCNSEELLVPVNDKSTVADPSSTNAEVQWHPDGERFVCSICLKGFAWKSSLVYHYRTHSGERLFACDKCDKRFRLKGELTRHRRRTHKGEKPFVCDDCGKRFFLSSDLARHIRTHTGEKPFACDKCDKRFRLKGDLYKHRHIHTGEKPYKCRICGKAFSQSSTRNRHYKNIHKKKVNFVPTLWRTILKK